jgi:hypothetical protein
MPESFKNTSLSLHMLVLLPPVLPARHAAAYALLAGIGRLSHLFD